MFKKLNNIGDCGIVCDFGEEVNREINSNVIKLFHHVKEEVLKGNLNGILNYTPSYNKLIINFDLEKINSSKIIDFLKSVDFSKLNLSQNSKKWIIPICYDFEMDLENMSKTLKINREEMVKQGIPLELVKKLFETMFHAFALHTMSASHAPVSLWYPALQLAQADPVFASPWAHFAAVLATPLSQMQTTSFSAHAPASTWYPGMQLAQAVPVLLSLWLQAAPVFATPLSHVQTLSHGQSSYCTYSDAVRNDAFGSFVQALRTVVSCRVGVAELASEDSIVNKERSERPHPRTLPRHRGTRRCSWRRPFQSCCRHGYRLLPCSQLHYRTCTRWLMNRAGAVPQASLRQ